MHYEGGGFVAEGKRMRERAGGNGKRANQSLTCSCGSLLKHDRVLLSNYDDDVIESTEYNPQHTVNG